MRDSTADTERMDITGQISARTVRKQVYLFVVLTFIVSWIIWLSPNGLRGRFLYVRIGSFSLRLGWASVVEMLGNIGPGFAAIILTTTTGGRNGLRSLLRHLMPNSAKPAWYLVALVLPFATMWAALAAQFWPATYHVPNGFASGWVRVFVINLFFAPLFEEIGWRGYLLPKLQSQHSGLVSALIIASIWGPWHIPLYWDIHIPGSRPVVFLVWFFLFITGESMILTWIYNRTRESLAIAVTLHGAANATTITLLGPMMQTMGIRPFMFVATATSLLAMAILSLTGTNLSYERGR